MPNTADLRGRFFHTQIEMKYRHLTNLRTPVDDVDARFLKILGDYKIGRPQRAPWPNAPMASELQQKKIIGVYTTAAAVRRPEVLELAGWFDGVILGPKLED